MKVTGFTFIRNAIIYDYPVVEAIRSILPICDDFVVAVGKSNDETLTLINNIDNQKIRIIETIWDECLRKNGKVLADETNKAFASVPEDSDWAFYIQADEVVHEKYLQTIYDAMSKYKDNTNVDGLLFKYLHFYGSYDYIGGSSKWYNHEIRIIRNNKSIYSYRDAQGFRKGNNEKLRVKLINAYIYHYGWVKHPVKMQEKLKSFHKMWHNDNWIEKHIEKVPEYDYFKNIDFLIPFTETHPEVMRERINAKNWKFEFDISFNRISLKDRFKQFAMRYFGIDIGYKNYIKI